MPVPTWFGRPALDLLVVASTLLAFAGLDRVLEPRFEAASVRELEAELGARAALLEPLLSAEAAPALGKDWDAVADTLGLRSGARVTLLARSGAILGDSSVPSDTLATLEDHRGRPEVQTALEGGRGVSTRVSSTVGRSMTYLALPMPRGHPVAVVRLAISAAPIDRSVTGLRQALAASAALAAVLALLAMRLRERFVSREVRELTQATARLASGDWTTRTRLTGTRDIARLGQALDLLASSSASSLRALHRERDLLGRILESMAEGVLVLDPDGLIVVVNHSLREMLLLPSSAEVAGRPLLEVVRHAELSALLERTRAGPSAGAGEIELAGLKPRRLLVQVSPLQLTAEAGTHGGLVAVFVDVTEVRRLETTRRDFVANVSHELRTPITAVLSATETLRGALGHDPIATERFLQIVERNAARLQELVEDLLVLSRVESRAFKLNIEPVALAPLASYTLGLFSERADKKGMTLASRVPDDLPAVLADRRALDQVVGNLVDNAVKYCSVGARVELGGTVDGGAVRLTVTDSGPGIEERHLARLFERFYRVDSGRSRDVGGTGLGLSIVKHLVEAMGGNVHVGSTPGQGTTFTVLLPREPARKN